MLIMLFGEVHNCINSYVIPFDITLTSFENNDEKF